MKETVITWTVANWITVFLMFTSMALFLGLLGRVYKSAKMAKGS